MVICEILKSMPEKEFDNINWIEKPDWKTFSDDIDKIVLDMINGGFQ